MLIILNRSNYPVTCQSILLNDVMCGGHIFALGMVFFSLVGQVLDGRSRRAHSYSELSFLVRRTFAHLPRYLHK
jgi:hypothetical protein